MKHLLLLVALLVAPLAAHAAANYTTPFPNISVATNASVGTLTATNAITAASYDFSAPIVLTPITAGTVIDFSATNRTASLTLTGAVTLAWSGLSGTTIKTYNVQVQNAQATNCTITLPAGTRKLGIIGYQTAGKGGRLYFEYWPGVSTNATYTEEQ